MPYASHAVASLFGGWAKMKPELNASKRDHVLWVQHRTRQCDFEDAQKAVEAERADAAEKRELEKAKRRKDMAALKKRMTTAAATAEKNRQKLGEFEQQELQECEQGDAAESAATEDVNNGTPRNGNRTAAPATLPRRAVVRVVRIPGDDQAAATDAPGKGDAAKDTPIGFADVFPAMLAYSGFTDADRAAIRRIQAAADEDKDFPLDAGLSVWTDSEPVRAADDDEEDDDATTKTTTTTTAAGRNGRRRERVRRPGEQK